MPRVRCYQVDAFTSRPFSGNPAAVCLLAAAHDDTWMQAMAAEMNLSETAFVRPLGDGYELRWFIPAVEVDLCGHATLAIAHILWQAGVVAPGRTIAFRTRSGPLTATRDQGLIELDFPATPATPVEPPDGLIEALGVRPVAVGRTEFDLLVELSSAREVRSLRPDFRRLSRVPTRGTIVTSRADEPGFDFVSRFFAPAVGIDEDPVTGSAHCGLAPYWAERLGKPALRAFQASTRGGVVRVRAVGDRVVLGGQAVTIWYGELSDEATAPKS